MCHRFSSPFVQAVHDVHDIDRLCILSVQKAIQRLNRTTQFYQYYEPGKIITLAFLMRIILWICKHNLILNQGAMNCELIGVIHSTSISLKL